MNEYNTNNANEQEEIVPASFTKEQLAAAVNESRREHRAYLEAAGWPAEAGYSFNNATTVVDLDAYRREGISDKIVDWYRAHSSTAINLDQDAQNVAFALLKYSTAVFPSSSLYIARSSGYASSIAALACRLSSS